MNQNMTIYGAQWRYEWRLQCRDPKNIVFSGLFFSMVTLFFPFTLSPDPLLLQHIAPSVCWVGLLFTGLLTTDRLFQTEYEEGLIEQWIVARYTLVYFVWVKIGVHSILCLLPIVVLLIGIAPCFALSWTQLGVIQLSFCVGFPAIMSVSALAAALGVGLPHRGIVMAIVVFPLVVPVMIFGSGMVHAAIQGLPVRGYVALLLAFSLLAMAGIPYAIAALLRGAYE